RGHGGRRRGRGAAVGWTVRPAPGVEGQLQRVQLLRRHRHLVWRERLQIVDPPLVEKGCNVRARQLNILLVLQLLKRTGVAASGGCEAASRTPESIRTNARRVDQPGRRCEIGSCLDAKTLRT